MLNGANSGSTWTWLKCDDQVECKTTAGSYYSNEIEDNKIQTCHVRKIQHYFLSLRKKLAAKVNVIVLTMVEKHVSSEPITKIFMEKL